jgi:copper transport protein
MRRQAAAAAPLAVATCVLSSPALAHPTLSASTPAAGARLETPPGSVTIRLSEHGEPVGKGISVKGPDGTEAGRGSVVSSGRIMSRLVDARRAGSYVVEWQAVGSDSHPARGAFIFSVGRPTRAVLPGGPRLGVGLQALGRWLSLLGFALGFGVPFAALVSGGMTSRLWRLVSTGIVLLLAAEPVALLGETATLSPSHPFDAGHAGDVLLTDYGHVTGLRLGAALGLWALAGAVRGGPSRLQWSIPAAGVVVALVEASSSHRFAGRPSALAICVAATHLGAFAAWLGCVVVALQERRGRLLRLQAVLAALVLLGTGGILALAHLGTPADLLRTAYGATLGVKVALVAGTLALGAAGRRQAELAAALVVLAAASLLVSLVPPV